MCATALYDPGANISMINKNFLAKLNKNIINTNEKYTFRTISGANKQQGIVFLKLKIFDTQKLVRFFVIDQKHFRYDILLGLDCIMAFRLCQDHTLKISQFQESKQNENNDTNKNFYTSTTNELKINPEFEVNYNEQILVENFEINFNHLNKHQKEQIEKILNEYSSVFAKDRYDIGEVRNYEAQIKLIEDRYIAQKPYRCSFPDQEEIEKQIKNLLNSNLIEESDSPFSAPVTLAYKKEDGKTRTKTRLCVDFRKLNELILPENYPFPLIDDLIAKTQDSSWFSIFDINSAFWSIPLRYQDRPKTGFVTQSGHWQWKCLPFGLKCCPSIFQRILSGIIRKFNLSSFCFNYLDDILIFSNTFEEHTIHIRRLLNAIKTEGFKLKFVKCTIATHSVKYLGHIIEKNTVRPLTDNLLAIRDFPTPKNQKNIRQFLGKINFYNKYIENSAKILEPFHNLLRKNVPFLWDEKCKKSFQQIKNYLMSSPVLAIFNRKSPINIYTDASIEGMGAILKQVQKNGIEKPVAYFSKKFSITQKKKKAIHLECIAIREAVKFWQYWLLGNKFTLFTDHKPLENLSLKSRTDEELGNLTNYLSQFDFTIKYKPGKENTEADCLSRNPIDKNFSEDTDILKTTNTLTLNEIINDQQKYITPTKNTTHIHNNIHYKKNTEQIILSNEIANRLIEKVHKSFGHIGSQCMLQTIRKHYYFTNMYKLITDYCKRCPICIKNKIRNSNKIGSLGLLGPASKPFEILSMDTIGGFGGRRSTKKYLHLAVDHFTRFAFISTSATQTKNDFIKLINRIQNDCNTQINTLLTDQHGGITSNEFQSFLKNSNIDIIFTATDCPFSNGLNERLNQTLVNRIRCKINENKNTKAWTTIAHECTYEYNDTIHSSTGFAPRHLLFGTSKQILPIELCKTSDLTEDRKIALKNSIRSHENNAKLYNKKRIDWNFNIGDLVYVDVGNKLNRTKLDEIRQGPFHVSKIISKHILEVDTETNPKVTRKYHVNKLVPKI